MLLIMYQSKDHLYLHKLMLIMMSHNMRRNQTNGHDRVPAVNYQKNIWDLDFLESLQSDHKKEKTGSGRIETLKEVVKDMIIDSSSKTSTKLELIDDLQRLGIGYNFEKEIKATLSSLPINTEDDLRCTSLYFKTHETTWL